MAITGTPRVFSDNSVLLFPTPEPGDMPVSAICMVVLTRFIFLDANASIAITRAGFISSTTPFTISLVSIPVNPSTPGEIEHTGLTPSSTCCGRYSCKCLVTIRYEETFGPNASGVMFQFPRPTTSTVSFSFRLRICSSSNATERHVVSYKSRSFSFNLGTSNVM